MTTEQAVRAHVSDPAVRKASCHVALVCRQRRDPEEINAARFNLAVAKLTQRANEVAARWPDRWAAFATTLATLTPPDGDA